MFEIPYCDSTGYFSVEVMLKHASNVFLVDATNLQRYNSGQRFEYYGGYYQKTPVTISVKRSGRWYLIVDNGEEYSYRFY